MLFLNLLFVGLTFSCAFLMIISFLEARSTNDHKQQVLAFLYITLNVCAFVLNLAHFIKGMF